MSILAKLFGNCGTIRFKIITSKDETFFYTTKIETFMSTQEEIETKLKQRVFVETGKYIKI